MVTQEHLEVAEQYVDLQQQIKALTEAQKLIKAEVQALVEQAGGKLEMNGVTLSIGHRKNWSYPYPIEEMEAELKQAKKSAETDGEATFEAKDYLICK